MARAYAFLVDDAPLPFEMEFAHAVKEFGVKAVTGKDILSVREIRDCVMCDYAQKIIQLYRAREASENWAEWEAKNPQQAKALAGAHEIYLKWRINEEQTNAANE